MKIPKNRFTSRINSQEGFTLLEVIISIAVLAIASVFILDMFVASANANLRAKSYDIALSKSIAFIEEFKSGEEPSVNLETTEFISAFYDIDFDEVADESVASYKIIMTLQEDLSQNPSFYPSSGRLFNICVTAIDLKAVEEKNVLLELKSAKYFPN